MVENRALKLFKVPAYKIDLADGKFIWCTQQAKCDLTIVTKRKKITLNNVLMNVLPGPPSPILIGRVELRRVNLPDMWTLLDRVIQAPSTVPSASANESAFMTSDPLWEWKNRRAALVKDEVDSLKKV